MNKAKTQIQVLDNTTQKMTYLKRLWVMTNEGLLLMKHVPEEKQCDRCQPEEFCPRGPLVDMKLEYERIDAVVLVP